MEHNLFRVKSLEEGKEAVVGSCNGFSKEERWSKETPVFAEKILKCITKIVPLGSLVSISMLDFGVGCGRLAKEILERSSSTKILGVDTSIDMLEQAIQYVNNERFEAKIPTDIPKDKKFDLIYCVYTLQHVPAIEIREILSRIYNHLKDDGFFIYCSSDYRMSIRFDGKGFFDDRFLGVNLQEEIERYFDKVEPLFIEEDFKDNYILKKMITGCDSGLAHPAFVYRKKIESKEVKPIIEVEGIPIYEKNGKLFAGKNAKEKVMQPQKLLLINRLSPGDILVMTNAIRDLHLAHPGKFITDVRTPCPDIFANNPYITKLTYNEANYNQVNTWFQTNIGKTKMLEDVMLIDMQYPLIHQSGARGAHFAEGHREFLEETLKIKIPQTKIRPELYLTEQEKAIWATGVLGNNMGYKGKYWIINAGSKGDYTLKQYPYYQEVVDLLKDKITFVQIGVKSHNHKPLENVIDMVGKTDNVRDLFSLIYNAEGVITCVAFPMHIAAAFKKPCVVVAGAREGTRWELYPNHRFIYVNGCLPCADYDGCWRSRQEECNYKKNGVPICMTLIKPEEVSREVERYYEGGILKYDIKEPVILNLKGEEKMDKEKIDFAHAGLMAEIMTNSNKDIVIEPLPSGINSPQATSSIFNILRILKQLTPSDTYLEAYQWHYDKRKDKFMDIYHFMQYLGATVRPKRILEIGTRTGISICQLLSAYLNYNELERVILCDLFNDGISTPSVVLNALKYLNIPVDKVQFIIGNSLEEIPKLMGKESFSYVLVDGSHDRNDAMQDLENSYKLIEKEGYVIFDDLSIDGCNLQPVWDNFKQKYYADFIFMEDGDNGKGIGIAKRI